MKNIFKFRFIYLLSFLLLMVACVPTDPASDAIETARPTATAIATATPIPAIDQIISELTAAGATVVNNGRTEQGLFPEDNIALWHLTINGTNVNVFEFSDTAAREAVSNNISPRGDEYTVTEGETTTKTIWDGESYSRWWVRDNLLVGYSGLGTAVADLINSILGQPFADGSQPYRPEAGSGSIAGTGEYGVSFQYDPYLAAGLSADITPGRPSAGPDDFIFDVMPDHITFTFLDSYASDWTIYHQTVNIPSQPQILIFPLEGYARMNQMAQEQITVLDSLLRDRPDLPNGPLPHLPPPNGQQDLQAQMAYLTFQNGQGIRYLTQFNQEPRQINNQEMYYTFQGITADHSHTIAAFFPVQSDSLPAEDNITDYEAFAGNMPSYLAQTTADLNQLPPAAFQPDLALLDALIQSLLVEPAVDLSASLAPPTDSGDLFCSHIAHPAMILSTPNGAIISNPLTGEQCPVTLPGDFYNLTAVANDSGYGFALAPGTNNLLIQQLDSNGVAQTLDFANGDDGSAVHGFILSSDGRQIIWSTAAPVTDGLLSSLWQADLDGQNKVQLVADWPEAHRIINPVRSDGETVYFSLQPHGIGGTWEAFTGRYDSLYRVTPGGEPEQLFECAENGMLCLGALSPDGSTLAYTDSRDVSLHLVQTDGTAITTITTTDDYSGYPIFLPNGDLAYYTAVIGQDSDSFPIAQPGTLYHLAAPYTGLAQEIISGNGLMLPVAAYDEQRLIINYNDELGQWGNALLNLSDSSLAPLQPWPGSYFVALLTAD